MYSLPHITASVFINDERGLHADYEEWLKELAPPNCFYLPWDCR
jgi:thiamine phosphate synthase YjbQ (UPF0047 family)